MKRQGFTRKLALAAASVAALSGIAGATSAQEVQPVSAQAPRVRFDIPAQPLSQALIEYSRQAHVAVAAPGDVVAGRRSTAVVGEMSTADALDRLLLGSGLRPQRNSAGGLTLVQDDSSSPTRLGAVIDAAPSAEEEIIVTAQKREERLQDVPISIVAMGSEELAQRNITRMDDLSLVVPGLSIQSAGGGWNRRITLRGVSNTFGTASLIGVYVDEAPATSGADLQLDLRTIDLERVEVLRGPQGTLYGEGSAGGTIRFITRAPDLEQFGVETNVAASFTQDGAPSQRIEGVLNLPVAENVFALRIAGTFDHQGGWIDQPAASQQDFNEQNTADVRIRGLWQITPDFTANATAIVHRSDGSTNTGEDSDGNYTQTFNQTTTPSIHDDYELYNLTLTYDLFGAQLMSASSFIDQTREQLNYGYRLPSAAPPATPYDVLKPLYTRDAEIFSQEFRLTSGEGPWQWTTGAFYRRSEIVNNNTFYFAIPGPPGSPLPALILAPDRAESEAWAVFGDTSYSFGNLTLGAGLRYFHDDQDYQAAAPQSQSFQALTPRVYAEYRLSDDANLYASISDGFRSGGFNRVAGRPPYDPEHLRTYELGAKFSAFEGRLRADLAAFHSDYEDYQVNGRPPSFPLNITSNAGNAEINGVEWGLTWRPDDAWTIGFNGTVSEAEFVEINSVGSSYAVGDPLDLFPEYNIGVSLQRDFSWSQRPAFVRIDFSQQGSMHFRNRSSGAFYFSQSDVIEMLSGNLGVDLTEDMSIGVFAQNLLNDRGYVDPFEIEETAARARPLTVGVELRAAFN